MDHETFLELLGHHPSIPVSETHFKTAATIKSSVMEQLQKHRQLNDVASAEIHNILTDSKTFDEVRKRLSELRQHDPSRVVADLENIDNTDLLFRLMNTYDITVSQVKPLFCEIDTRSIAPLAVAALSPSAVSRISIPTKLHNSLLKANRTDLIDIPLDI